MRWQLEDINQIYLSRSYFYPYLRDFQPEQQGMTSARTYINTLTFASASLELRSNTLSCTSLFSVSSRLAYYPAIYARCIWSKGHYEGFNFGYICCDPLLIRPWHNICTCYYQVSSLETWHCLLHSPLYYSRTLTDFSSNYLDCSDIQDRATQTQSNYATTAGSEVWVVICV